jgi:rod shape determining protein RodA
MTMSATAGRPRGLGDRFSRLNWAIITLLCALAATGVIMHFSVAEGSWMGRPLLHGSRFSLTLAVVVLAVVLLDARIWMASAYWVYCFSLLLLILVEVMGQTRMGATRWLALPGLSSFAVQPSEFMKVGIILALARYYNNLDPKNAGSLIASIPPLMLIVAPVALVMHQPDLGTSLLIAAAGVGIMFLASLRWRYIAPAAVAAVTGAVAAYFFVLQQYQRDRIITFLNPDADPLGTGYHVAQSKIAIGSAGLFGKGYLQGSQAQLDFLPEKHTDFIFTMISEEFGLLGALAVLGMYFALFLMTMGVAIRARSMFGRLASAGVAITLALYVFINTAMVIGLVPVVGIPLPLISFGGTAMLTLMAGYTIVLSVDLHRDASSTRGLLW